MQIPNFSSAVGLVINLLTSLGKVMSSFHPLLPFYADINDVIHPRTEDLSYNNDGQNWKE